MQTVDWRVLVDGENREGGQCTDKWAPKKFFLGRNVPLFYFLPSSSSFVQTAAWPVWVWVVGVLRLLLLAANAAAAAAITAVVVFCCCFEFPFFFWRSLPPLSSSSSSNVCGLHPHLIIEFTTTFLIESTIFLLLLLFISFFKGGPFLSFFCPVHATNVHICGQSNCQHTVCFLLLPKKQGQVLFYCGQYFSVHWRGERVRGLVTHHCVKRE